MVTLHLPNRPLQKILEIIWQIEKFNQFPVTLFINLNLYCIRNRFLQKHFYYGLIQITKIADQILPEYGIAVLEKHPSDPLGKALNGLLFLCIPRNTELPLKFPEDLSSFR